MSLRSSVEEMYGLKIADTVRVHDVHMIRTADGSYCLKRYRFPEEAVCFITKIFYWLYMRGFTRGQALYPTVTQAPYMAHDGLFYTLTNWVDGDRPDFQKSRNFKKAIRTLAKFHSAAEAFPPGEAPPGRIRYDEAGREVEEYKDLLALYENTSFLVPLCDEILFLLSQPLAVEAVASEQRLCAFVHGDYNYPNLIKDRRNKLHLIDFENTSLNVRMKDLSHILHRNFLWNGKETLRWVEYYGRTRPLGVHDMHLLHALLTAPYHVVRNIRIGGIRHAGPVIPTGEQLHKYRRELRELL